ncbi:MAG: MerC domain-containing protein [Bacteroidota bacterium]
MRKFFSWHLDFVGFGASLFCALHCILIPLILSFGIFAGTNWLTNPLGEQIFIGISIGIASWSLLQSYFSKHQNIRPLLIAGFGFLALVFLQMKVIFNPHGFTAISGGLIAYAHFYNWRLSNQLTTKTKYLNATSRAVVIGILSLYSLGLYRAFTHDQKAPKSEELLEIVWRVPD